MAVNKTNFLQIAFIAVAIYVVYMMFFRESFEPISGEQHAETLQQPKPEQQPQQEQPQFPTIEMAPEMPKQQVDEIIQDKPQLSADELLPKYDEANEFAQQNPVSDLLKEQNFLISGYHMGVNTVMSSNKIAYHDLRAAPPIPKQTIGPFLQSSYETPAGTNRRSMEIL